MRILVISDLHANLEATSSVLVDARARGFDSAVVLGDLVGYGASPNEVVDMVRQLAPAVSVRGNHDKAACGTTGGENFNDVARTAILWTRSALRSECIEYLAALPQGPLDAGGFHISHGTPLDEEDYLLGEADARFSFESLPFEVVFFGHTHFTCAFTLMDGNPRLQIMTQDHGSLELAPGRRYLVNPGSVGQPRDHNPNAAYAIFDTETRRVEWHRVAYDWESARARIVGAGLPEVLGHRLVLGV